MSATAGRGRIEGPGTCGLADKDFEVLDSKNTGVRSIRITCKRENKRRAEKEGRREGGSERGRRSPAFGPKENHHLVSILSLSTFLIW